MRHMENKRFAMLPAVSAVAIPATIMIAKVALKIKNISMYKNMSAPRRWTAPVGMALR